MLEFRPSKILNGAVALGLEPKKYSVWMQPQPGEGEVFVTGERVR